MPETIERTYSYFDPATFEQVSEKVAVSYEAPKSLEEAMQRVGSDQTKILKALDALLRRETFREAKRQTLSKGVPRKVVFSVLRPFRALPPWASIEDKKEQTKQLLAMLRQSPAIIDAIKAAALQMADADDDDDNEGDDE